LTCATTGDERRRLIAGLSVRCILNEPNCRCAPTASRTERGHRLPRPRQARSTSRSSSCRGRLQRARRAATPTVARIRSRIIELWPRNSSSKTRSTCEDRMALQRLREAAEKANEPRAPQTQINLPFIAGGPSGPCIRVDHEAQRARASPPISSGAPRLQAHAGRRPRWSVDIGQAILVGGADAHARRADRGQEFLGRDPHSSNPTRSWPSELRFRGPRSPDKSTKCSCST
jgi:hypothetical protein